MGAKKEELPRGNPVAVSPAKIAVEAGNWEASSLFTVQNRSDETLCQIRVKVFVDYPHIRIQDFTIESPRSTGGLDLGVGQVRTSYDFVVLSLEGSEGKKATCIVIRRLNPGETCQFTVTKRSPYVPAKQYALYARIVGFGREPARR
jgi:hypothetical protein